jgi:hypothetical protein
VGSLVACCCARQAPRSRASRGGGIGDDNTMGERMGWSRVNRRKAEEGQAASQPRHQLCPAAGKSGNIFSLCSSCTILVRCLCTCLLIRRTLTVCGAMCLPMHAVHA